MIGTVGLNPVPQDRRQYGRVLLDRSLRAWIAERVAFVADVSMNGFCVAHENRYPPGAEVELRVEWNGLMMQFRCRIMSSKLHRLAKSPTERSIYRSGLRIIRSFEASQSALKALIESAVVRALEQQLANAHGVPPLIPSYERKKSESFLRCELVDGVWRQRQTQDPAQPYHGFTVSASVDRLHIAMLCDTWERATEEERRFTQLLASLSVNPDEGVPTRRYVP